MSRAGRCRAAVIGVLLAGFAPAGYAQTEAAAVARSPLDPRLINNLRLRYEAVDDDARPGDADAVTLRYRGTLEVDATARLTLLAEVESVAVFVDDFDNGTGGKPSRPVIPEPAGTRLNRIQAKYDVTDDIRVTAGRQRIALDDQRFVGARAFRQNDQTLDGVRVAGQVAPGLLGGGILLDASYIQKAVRIRGDSDPFQDLDGEAFLVNANVGTPLGRVAAFHYALDFETGPDADVLTGATIDRQVVASQTTGARLEGRRSLGDWAVGWEAAYARQSDFRQRTADFSADYGLVALNAERRGFQIEARREVLGGDGQASFQTPLSSLHRFQGDADIFMMTPVHGVVDHSLRARLTLADRGPWSRVFAQARVHRFDADFVAEDGRHHYGDEVDLLFNARFRRSTLQLNVANYRADILATDTQRVFVTLIHPF